jgi:hypothetical protein
MSIKKTSAPLAAPAMAVLICVSPVDRQFLDVLPFLKALPVAAIAI